jgi:hypothetical protein
MDSIGAWLVIAVGAFIVWKAWGRKKVQGTARPVLFIPVAGAPARKRGNPLMVVILIVVFVLFWHFVVDRKPSPEPLPPPFPHLAPPGSRGG